MINVSLVLFTKLVNLINRVLVQSLIFNRLQISHVIDVVKFKLILISFLLQHFIQMHYYFIVTSAKEVKFPINWKHLNLIWILNKYSVVCECVRISKMTCKHDLHNKYWKSNIDWTEFSRICRGRRSFNLLIVCIVNFLKAFNSIMNFWWIKLRTCCAGDEIVPVCCLNVIVSDDNDDSDLIEVNDIFSHSCLYFLIKVQSSRRFSYL